MRKSKRIIILLLAFILCISDVGCFNYRDINQVIFASTVICDIDDEDNIVLYYESMKPFRSTGESSEKGKREIYRGTGKSILEAAKNINSATSYEVNFSQCRSYIFTEKAARKGIQQYLDALNREQEFIIRPYVLVYYGDINEMLEKVNVENEGIGTYVNQLVNKTKTNPTSIATTINQYLSERSMDYSNIVVGALRTKEDGKEIRLQLNGGAIFKNDVLTDNLNETDTIYYKFINDKVGSGIIKLENTSNEGEGVILQIIESKTNSNITYEDNITLTNNIWIKCNIGEVKGRGTFDEQILRKIEKNCSEKIDEELTRTFYKYKNKELDIFNINRRVNEEYKEKNLGYSPIKDTVIKNNIKLSIVGTGVIEESY